MRPSTLLVAVVLAGCGDGATPPSASHAWTVDADSARFTDPPETRRLTTSRGRPSPDLRKIAVSSDGREAIVTATFGDAWSACFDTEELGDIVLEMWIDSDSNESTGGVLLGGTRRGFESCIKVAVGSEIDFASTPEVLTGHSASYGLTALRQGEDDFAASRRHTPDDLKESRARQEESKSRCRLQGAELQFSIPYEFMGAAPGQAVRIVFLDRYGDTYNAESLLPPLEIKLR